MKSIEKGEVDHAELIQEPSALSEEWKSSNLLTRVSSCMEMMVSSHSSSTPFDSDSLLPEQTSDFNFASLLRREFYMQPSSVLVPLATILAE